MKTCRSCGTEIRQAKAYGLCRRCSYAQYEGSDNAPGTHVWLDHVEPGETKEEFRARVKREVARDIIAGKQIQEIKNRWGVSSRTIYRWLGASKRTVLEQSDTFGRQGR